MEQGHKTIKRTFEGLVTSKAGDKTIVVKVTQTKLHPKYLKRYTVSKKYKVHDPLNAFAAGNTVKFVECRPISKDKRWRVIDKKS